jgi:hypothetical protein
VARLKFRPAISISSMPCCCNGGLSMMQQLQVHPNMPRHRAQQGRPPTLDCIQYEAAQTP